MSDSIPTGALAGATIAINPPMAKRRGFFAHCGRIAAACGRGLRRTMPRIPLMLYFLAAFAITKLTIMDVRATAFFMSGYALDYVEVMYIIAFGFSMIELLRVAHPGIDNTHQVNFMYLVAGIYIVVFALAAAAVAPLVMFKNSEFLVVTVIVVMQAVMAQRINSATLKRTIDNTDGHTG